MPMKDEFSGDESEIEMLDKDDDLLPNDHKHKRISKKPKSYTWKLKWVPVPNSVPNSKPLFIRRWVKIKIELQKPDNEAEESKLEGKRESNETIRNMAAQIIDSNREEIRLNQEAGERYD